MHYYGSLPKTDLQWLRKGSDKSKSIKKAVEIKHKNKIKMRTDFLNHKRLHPSLIQKCKMTFWVVLRRSIKHSDVVLFTLRSSFHLLVGKSRPFGGSRQLVYRLNKDLHPQNHWNSQNHLHPQIYISKIGTTKPISFGSNLCQFSSCYFFWEKDYNLKVLEKIITLGPAFLEQISKRISPKPAKAF